MAIHWISKQLSLGDNSFNTSTTIDQVKDWLESKVEFQYDIETSGLNFKKDRILLYQFGDWDDQFVIDNRYYPVTLFSDILQGKDKVKIGHNLSFEYKFCREAGIVMDNLYDTFLAEKCLYRGFKLKGYGFKDVVKRYLDIEIEKGVRASFIGHSIDKPFSDSQIIYASIDVKPLQKVKELQYQDGVKKGINYYIKLENLANLPLSDIEYDGLETDTVSWTKNATKNEQLFVAQELELDKELIALDPKFEGNFSYQVIKGKRKLANFQYDLFRPDLVPERKTKINWSSSKQKLAIFKKYLDLTPEKKGKPTADIKVLAQIKNPPKLVELLIAYGEKGKELSTYGHYFVKNYITNLFDDNRIRTSFSQIQDTGRTSSGNSDKNNKGTIYWFPTPNAQNIPQDYRKFFKAVTGWKLVGCDYTSQEPRLLASRCQDPILLDFYENGDGDLYSLTASKMYSVIEGKEIEVPPKIEDDPERFEYYNKHPNKWMRQVGKVLSLKLNYGGAAYTVKDDLGVSEEEAQVFVDSLSKAFAGRTAYQNTMKEFGINHGYVITDEITGAKTWFYEYEEYKQLDSIPRKTKLQKSRFFKLKGNIERKSLNYPIQGGSAAMSKLALHYAREAIRAGNYQDSMKLVAFVHDEIVMECRDELVEVGANLLSNAMTKAAKIFCPHVEIKAEPNISQYWTK